MKPAERRKQDEEDLRAVLSSPAGRRFFHRLLTQSGLYGGSYTESATATAFNEGRRSVAIALVGESQRIAPELYARGLREALDALELAQLEASKPEAAEP